MTSLHLICGLGPPQSKILATPMRWYCSLILTYRISVRLRSSALEAYKLIFGKTNQGYARACACTILRIMYTGPKLFAQLKICISKNGNSN